MTQAPKHDRCTPVANADLLGDKASLAKPDFLEVAQAAAEAAPQPASSEGKPGKGINQAGFLKNGGEGRP